MTTSITNHVSQADIHVIAISFIGHDRDRGEMKDVGCVECTLDKFSLSEVPEDFDDLKLSFFNEDNMLLGVNIVVDTDAFQRECEESGFDSNRPYILSQDKTVCFEHGHPDDDDRVSSPLMGPVVTYLCPPKTKFVAAENVIKMAWKMINHKL